MHNLTDLPAARRDIYYSDILRLWFPYLWPCPPVEGDSQQSLCCAHLASGRYPCSRDQAVSFEEGLACGAVRGRNGRLRPRRESRSVILVHYLAIQHLKVLMTSRTHQASTLLYSTLIHLPRHTIGIWNSSNVEVAPSLIIQETIP